MIRLFIFLTLVASPALAQQTPGTVVDGAPSVTIGGQPAARQQDNTSTGARVTGGSANVFINGRGAATIGSRTECGGIVVSGSPNVFINGRPAATASSAVTPCPGESAAKAP
ncbi:MAG: PAAR domain-containing protein [Proteobacteria bacterium]|nr:PAAR domain-containing protein [Pseudomonadota bacterium]